jgi:hypothetical protein
MKIVVDFSRKKIPKKSDETSQIHPRSTKPDRKIKEQSGLHGFTG